MGVKLGMNAKLYRNKADYASPDWEEITNVKDLTLNLDSAEADVTTRKNAGWRATVRALKDGSIEFDMVWDTADEGFDAIQDGYFLGTPIELAIMDGDMDDPGEDGVEGLRATCAVTGFTRNEPLEEAITVSVTVKPTYAEHPPEWMNVPPES